MFLKGVEVCAGGGWAGCGVGGEGEEKGRVGGCVDEGKGVRVG